MWCCVIKQGCEVTLLKVKLDSRCRKKCQTQSDCGNCTQGVLKYIDMHYNRNPLGPTEICDIVLGHYK